MARKKNKRTLRNLRMRKKLWPDLEDGMVWDYNVSDGFVSIPRAMPYFFKIMDDCSKSKPLSSTYFTLWCRCWDESGFLKINNPSLYASESGFSGQRAVSTWRARMRLLEKWGYIKSKRFGADEHGYVVIINPYKVVKNLHETTEHIDEGWYYALNERAYEIKAPDLEDDD